MPSQSERSLNCKCMRQLAHTDSLHKDREVVGTALKLQRPSLVSSASVRRHLEDKSGSVSLAKLLVSCFLFFPRSFSLPLSPFSPSASLSFSLPLSLFLSLPLLLPVPLPLPSSLLLFLSRPLALPCPFPVYEVSPMSSTLC